VTVRSKVLVCGRSLAGIAGSKPARELDIVSYECCVLSGTESLLLADPSFRGVLLGVFVSLFVAKRNINLLRLLRVCTKKSEEEIKKCSLISVTASLLTWRDWENP
jgi:hypothetical protein